MSKNMKKTEAILREMVMITLRGELTKIQRTNLETCITIHMHQKESTGMQCLGDCLTELVPHRPVQPLCGMDFVLCNIRFSAAAVILHATLVINASAFMRTSC